MKALKQVLMERDNLSEQEAEDLIQESREAVYNGANPDAVLYETFGLEPDYIFDLL